MAEEILRLGAATVIADTNKVLYSCASLNRIAVSGVNVCNTSSNDYTYGIAHIDGAKSDLVAEDWIDFNESIESYRSITIRKGICLTASHTLLVRSNNASVVFMAWGSKLS